MTMYNLTLSTSHFPAQNDAEIRDVTVGGLLREVAATHPDAVAMVDVADGGDCGQSWTYGELLTRAESLANALVTRFEAGERVVVWAPNIPEWIFMEYACGLSGLVLVTANPSFQASELKYVLEQSGAVGLFMVDTFRGNPMAAIAREATDGNTALREVVNLEDAGALFTIGGRPAKLPDVQPDDPAQIQYTSGTTGFPKGAVLSHKNLVNNARLFCARKQVGPQSVWANFMPLFHTAGCATGALGCLQAAAKMLLIKRFDADVFARLIEEQGVTTCFAVPTMLFNLLESLDRTPRDMSSLEVITTGGAPVPPDLVRRVRDRLGCHLLSAFGQTEHSPMICLNPVEATLEQIVETAGQPLPQTEVSIRSPEDNRVLPIGEVGEICARSYAVMIGYNDNQEATAAAIDADGWLHTGDLGTIDRQGFVRVTGRVKDMIIRGGENHFPAEIEAVLVTHPDVAQTAVVGLPDEKWGEVIAAFILSDTAPNVEHLRTHCRAHLSAQKTPSVWVHVPYFPLTGSGKVQKFVLRERFLEGSYGERLE
ncbi:AMP-binding protein [Pseudohalocynthiibacter sp. F2068]|jgi:long-chain acyl-CoA synthetase|uniref:class I adenylate-forming enzyme family protein n=1 Tax=Pseudohalocynthiibacter sp. F2068 TaxID=2926418 RepID=UPI001FF3303A|nr:AMP-binding protein [Pseudohalocynthiibacter sp. F2068]MCK0104182.1 AMP-binding protein [Pseudohalocynthiibacter sp. F2068]